MDKLQLRRLGPSDLNHLLELQNNVINNFKEDEKHFILERSPEEFLKSLQNENHFVFGFFDGKKLVSQSILSMPSDTDKREISEFLPNRKNSEIAVYKAVIVDPAYRGHGIMKEMLKLRENTARMHGKKVAISQIAADNPASWINAIQYGMEIHKVGLDPDDGAKVVYLQKDLTQNTNNTAVKPYKLSLGSDVHKNANILFNKMKKLSDDGYIVYGWDKQDNSLLWKPSQEFSNTQILQAATGKQK
ncbi:MAG: GNAT family N-acetyltransferase [Alphaproteobacteria bacterium]